jgi:hypothetical protein
MLRVRLAAAVTQRQNMPMELATVLTSIVGLILRLLMPQEGVRYYLWCKNLL